MIIKIIGLLIGILLLGVGIYYTAKEREDPESRKIYTVFSVIGAVLALICILLLVF